MVIKAIVIVVLVVIVAVEYLMIVATDKSRKRGRYEKESRQERTPQTRKNEQTR